MESGGLASVKRQLEDSNIKASEEEMKQVLLEVEKLAFEKKRLLNRKDSGDLVHNALNPERRWI